MTISKRLNSIKLINVKTTLFLSVLFTICISLSNCEITPAEQTPLQQGEALAKKYCGTCHKYPEPALVDNESWIKHVLPAMAPRLGIQVYAEDQYVNNPNAKSTVTFDEWLKIVAFYKNKAPVHLKAAVHTQLPGKNWLYFSLKKPLSSQDVAMTTMVSFDTVTKKFFTSEASNNTLNQWSDKLTLQNQEKFSSPAVDAKFIKDSSGVSHGVFTFIGSMDAYDRETGILSDINLKNINSPSSLKHIAMGLNRAVQSVTADFNKDGLADWAVCEFGHNRGGLSLLTQDKTGKFSKKSIRPIAGATSAIVGDFNGDKWPDLMCLFAQGDEGIWMFINDHKGGFVTKNILRFPPVYGSTSFQLIDINNDGKLDILYTCGDNSDYSRVLKPYHGVYIFLNQGDYKFKQAWFYPVNGATKAIAADFNGDGRIDIAAIAFFSDLKDNPAEGFTYFEQTEKMKFSVNNIPVFNQGRWICMDVNDYNNDGKPDILLGNFSVGFINQSDVKKQWDTKTPFIILQNISKK